MMEPTIHQLYCTHCTYGTSYLHQRTTGAVKDQSFEYSARAGSIRREESHDYFRKIEPYLYYHLPGDLPRDQMLKHDAGTTADWQRFVYLPSVEGMQVLAWVSYRTTDTQGRPGSYFAHVLLSERPNGEPAWSAADALKLWGSLNWVVRDTEFPVVQLKTHRSLDEFQNSGPRTVRMIDDQVLLSFLTAPKGTPFDDDPGQLIPARWKEKSPSERQELLIDTLQGFLELNFKSRQTMLLAIEPCLSALIFYGVARLLPKSGIGEKLSFSTFESHEHRPQTALAATTFVNTSNSVLPRDPSQSRGFAVNTFKPPEESPVLPWKQRKNPPEYARKLVKMFVEPGGPEAVDELLLAFKEAGAVSKEELNLEGLIQTDALSDAFLAGDSHSAAARLITMGDSPKKYLRQTVQSRLFKIMQSSGPAITAVPPPPPSSAVENRQAEASSSSIDSTALAPKFSAPATMSQGSSELRRITDHPARVLDILKLIAAEKATGDAQTVVTNLLAEYVKHGREQFDQLLRTESLVRIHKQHALRMFVERHKQIPDGCGWLWTDTKAVNGQPALLTKLLIDLDDDSAKALLTGFLEKLEKQPASDKIIPVCDALVQAIQEVQAPQTPESKRGLLVEFVDHEKLTDTTLLSALRTSSAIRKPVFEQYAKQLRQDDPQGKFRLPGLLKSEVEKLTDTREFSRLLDFLHDGRPLLSKKSAEKVDAWLKVRKQFEEIKKLSADEPSLWSRLKGNANDAKFQEHGKELAKESQKAMPNEEYQDDYTGEERCGILQSVGNQLLAPRKLPTSFWSKLSAEISGNEILREKPPADSAFSSKLSAEMSGSGRQIPHIGPVVDRSNRTAKKFSSQVKSWLPAAAVILLLVGAVSGGGWFVYRQVFGPRTLEQLASVAENERVAAFLNLSDEQFADLLRDEKFLADDRVIGSINDGLTSESLRILKNARCEKWIDCVWSILTPEKLVDLLLKLPAKEQGRPLQLITGLDQTKLVELFKSKGPKREQFAALANRLGERQLKSLLKDLPMTRRVEVLIGLDAEVLAKLDDSVLPKLVDSVLPKLFDDDLEKLVLKLPEKKLPLVLAKVTDKELKKLLDSPQFQKEFKTKLESVARDRFAELTRPPAPVQLPRPMPNTDKPTQPQPERQVAKKPAELKPEETPAPSNENTKPSQPAVPDLPFEKGPEDRLIAYQSLPDYPKQAEQEMEVVVALPGEWEEPTDLILHGFDEHKKRFSDNKWSVPKLVTKEGMKGGKTLRVLMEPDSPELCEFGIRRPNLATFKWKFIKDSMPLQDAICSCVLEINRSQQPSLFVSFLPPKKLKEPLDFNGSGVRVVTKELKSFALCTPLILGMGAIHAAEPGKKADPKSFPFAGSAEKPSRMANHSLPVLAKTFEFETAEVRLETSRGIKGTSKGTTSDEEFKLSLTISRELNQAESKQLAKATDDEEVLRKNWPAAKKGSDKTKRYEALKKIIGVFGAKEPDGIPPEDPKYAQWAARLLESIPEKMEALKAVMKQQREAPKTARDNFLKSELSVSGTVFRVVGGKRDGDKVTGGVVVKAFEMPPPGIVGTDERTK